MSRVLGALLLALGLTAALAGSAAGFEAGQVFRKGTLVVSGEGGGGSQSNLSGGTQTGLSLWYASARLGLLPFGTAGPGPFRGAFEVGIGPVFQRYTEPVNAYYAGLAAVLRYHFVSLGRLVPYVEAAGAFGGTDLRVREIDSDVAFWLAAGAGASVFVTDRAAIYAGYRLVHVSNGNIDTPNKGFEAHTGMAGVAFYFDR
ncbi:MAG TPA: acyloxyacyl hydrolase [Methylomirabilota bacterium]|nr:acyloxyacyl hydrolase [Methylomirabilota bacterium]